MGRSGPNLEVLCRTCDYKKYDPDPYVSGLYRIHLLQVAGMVFESDDFTSRFWLDLGRFKLIQRAKEMFCPVFGGKK